MINKVIDFVQNCTCPEQLKLIKQAAIVRLQELEHQDEFGAGKPQKTQALGVDVAANPGRNLGSR
jgi:hypothetical protein